MLNSKTIIALVVLVLVAGGAIALLTMDIPAPTEQVERTLPDDQFPR